jgi:CO/xanthine dehydrogenase Mo-binding subunit
MNIALNRRSLLAGAGALTVSVVLPGAKARAAVVGAAKRPALKPENLSTYISINADGSAVAYWGKLDMGQGTDIGILQIVAEELDLPADRVEIVQGDTNVTVNQGGASGSTGIQSSGIAMRAAAAEARFQLLRLASQQLGAPADQLSTSNGVVSVKNDPSKKATYGELIGGRFFDTQLEWNKKIGNALAVKGEGKPKPVSEYKVVGTPVRRRDVPEKLLARAEYIVDVKVPGMVHARMILPPVVGAVPTAVDESSIKGIAGAQVVHIKDFLAVVAPREWDAIKASQQLKVTWSDAKPPFPDQKDLYDHIRTAPVVKRHVDKESGDVDAAFKGAAKVIEAAYEWPFQSHAGMAPACAVVDYRPDGITTVWTPTQKPHYGRDGVANILGLPHDKVRGVYVFGPGSYGRNDSGDAAAAAALISKAVGKPVRMQFMREEGTGWDPKGPASVHTARAAIDKDGNVIGWHFESKGFSRLEVASNESQPAHTLPGQLTGAALKFDAQFGTPAESYGFPAKRKAFEVIAPLVERSSPLRTSHLRDPVGPQVTFASESFIDELAYALKTDPVAFRLKHLKDARDQAVVKAAAEKAGWKPHTAPRKEANGAVATGQGIAYAQRGGTRVAIVAEVEVDLKSGKVRNKRTIVAHDCGLIVNPQLLKLTIEGNVVQGTSRAVCEEVRFDNKTVTSVDWQTYPILDMSEAPESVEIVLINRPDVKSTGAGEATSRPIAAAIANAIYDATGVRLRQAPLTPERIKSGLV